MTSIESNIPPVSKVTLQYITTSITTIGLMLNSLVIFGIFKSRKLRSLPDLYFNINLSMTDLLLCILWILTQTYNLDCNMTGFLLYLLLACSVFNLLSIAFIHFHSIMFEKTINNRITIWILIGMIWLISLCGSILGYRLSKHGFILQPSELYCLNDFTLQGSIITFFNYGIVLTLIGTPILLTLIYFIIWKKLNHHEIYVPSNRISLRHSKIKIVNAKVLIVRRAMALSLGFAIVYYFQATIFVYQIKTGKFIDWIYDAIGATLVSLNTIVYPITFLALDLRCRQAIFDFFGFIHGQSTNSNTSDAYTGQ